jgi:membrane-bound ClpP family serine protease
MIWLGIYVLIGVLAILVNSRRHEKMGVIPSGIFAFDLWLFPVAVALWPLVILFSNIDANVQIQAKEEKERSSQNKTRENEELSSLVGACGRALTILGPHGKIEIDSKQFGAVSESGYLPCDSEVRVLGVGPFSELRVGKADPDAGINSVTSLRDSTP